MAEAAHGAGERMAMLGGSFERESLGETLDRLFDGRKPATKRGPKKREAKCAELGNAGEQTEMFGDGGGSVTLEEQSSQQQVGTIATVMACSSLPHSHVPGNMFQRHNGETTITLTNTAGLGLPWGKIPRIITAFLCTEAKRTGEPVIYLGKSRNAFARKLGLHTSGGGRGDLPRLAEQAIRLFTSTISLVERSGKGARIGWEKIDLTRDGMLLWDPQDPDKQAEWESRLTLSEKFFRECVDHAVPIDLGLLDRLRSPMAIDIYVWLTYRYNALWKTGQSVSISWLQLKRQFGANYADDKQGLANFACNFRLNLKRVASEYRTARFRVDHKKLTLDPSPPHVPPKQPRSDDQ